MAKISVAAVFSDNMVLQRDKNINIFGWVEWDESDKEIFVKAELFDKAGGLIGENVLRQAQEPQAQEPQAQAQELQAQAQELQAKAQKWILTLPAQKAQEDCSLKINLNNSESISFSGIAIGEVWLAGGQSNMEFELQNCTEGPEELADSRGENGANKVRFYYTNKIAWIDQHFYQAEKNTCWQKWESSTEGRKAWSAVGYFFAKKLAHDLDCTVGIIGCNWGGTSASTWMRREYLEKDIELKTYLDEQEEGTAGKSIEEQCREFDEYEKVLVVWQKKCAELYAKEPDIKWSKVEEILGKAPWPGPRSCKNSNRPCGLYECMVNRVLPYTIKGVIWYQGESDDHKPNSYAKLFSNMIENWRTDWKDAELPFVFVQLPCHRNEYDQDFKHWCIIRQQQEKVWRQIKNTYMTCALDLGQFNDIHPKAKRKVGERLEENAMANVYSACSKKSPSEVLSPILKSYIIKGSDPAEANSFGQIEISFDNAAQGFVAHQDKTNLDYYKQMEAHQGKSVSAAFTGFEIAGSDGVFYPAAYKFGQNLGKAANIIILSSPLVKNPAAARYAWYNYGPVNIYGKNGLPLAPFYIFS